MLIQHRPVGFEHVHEVRGPGTGVAAGIAVDSDIGIGVVEHTQQLGPMAQVFGFLRLVVQPDVDAKGVQMAPL